jgi:hypothetical protein
MGEVKAVMKNPRGEAEEKEWHHYARLRLESFYLKDLIDNLENENSKCDILEDEFEWAKKQLERVNLQIKDMENDTDEFSIEYPDGLPEISGGISSYYRDINYIDYRFDNNDNLFSAFLPRGIPQKILNYWYSIKDEVINMEYKKVQ